MLGKDEERPTFLALLKTSVLVAAAFAAFAALIWFLFRHIKA